MRKSKALIPGKLLIPLLAGIVLVLGMVVAVILASTNQDLRKDAAVVIPSPQQIICCVGGVTKYYSGGTCGQTGRGGTNGACKAVTCGSFGECLNAGKNCSTPGGQQGLKTAYCDDGTVRQQYCTLQACTVAGTAPKPGGGITNGTGWNNGAPTEIVCCGQFGTQRFNAATTPVCPSGYLSGACTVKQCCTGAGLQVKSSCVARSCTDCQGINRLPNDTCPASGCPILSPGTVCANYDTGTACHTCRNCYYGYEFNVATQKYVCKQAPPNTHVL